MDKYDIALDLVEHPAEYTPEKIVEILSDPEIREIYNLLCKTYSALSSTDAVANVDAEWQSFSQSHRKPRFSFLWRRNRAASIAVIAFTSLAAAAIGITVAIKTFDHKPQPLEVVVEPSVESHIASSETIGKDSTITAEEVAVSNTPIVFEDTSLEEILIQVAEVHGATVEYKTPETAQLHLYYRFDPTIPLKETVEQLNTFEQISIGINGKQIIVD